MDLTDRREPRTRLGPLQDLRARTRLGWPRCPRACADRAWTPALGLPRLLTLRSGARRYMAWYDKHTGSGACSPLGGTLRSEPSHGVNVFVKVVNPRSSFLLICFCAIRASSRTPYIPLKCVRHSFRSAPIVMFRTRAPHIRLLYLSPYTFTSYCCPALVLLCFYFLDTSSSQDSSHTSRPHSHMSLLYL